MRSGHVALELMYLTPTFRSAASFTALQTRKKKHLSVIRFLARAVIRRSYYADLHPWSEKSLKFAENKRNLADPKHHPRPLK